MEFSPAITVTARLDLAPETRAALSELAAAVLALAGNGALLTQVARDVGVLQQQVSRELWNALARNERAAPDASTGGQSAASTVRARDVGAEDAPAADGPALPPSPTWDVAAPVADCSGLPAADGISGSDSRVWTQARVAALRAGFMAFHVNSRLRDAVNALPGPGVSAVALKAQIQHLGLRAERPLPAAPVHWRTPERLELLRQGWPAGLPTQTLWQRMSRLPGPPVPRHQIAIWAADRGLLRPRQGCGPDKPVVTGAPAPADSFERRLPDDEAKREHKAVGEPLSAPLAPLPVPTARVWRTAERLALLRELWPAGVPIPTVRARLAALPGAEPGNIAGWAAQHKLRRPAATGEAGAKRRSPNGMGAAAVDMAPAPPTEANAQHAEAHVLRGTARPHTIYDGSNRAAPGPTPSVPRGIPAVPPELATRDGAPSLAKRMELDDQQISNEIDLLAAEEWGRRNGIERRSGESNAKLLRRINEAREICGLPGWRLMPKQPPHLEALPPLRAEMAP